jgi:hypothetical protein
LTDSTGASSWTKRGNHHTKSHISRATTVFESSQTHPTSHSPWDYSNSNSNSMTSLVLTYSSGRDVVPRICCCGNTKASWLVSWHRGLPFWVPGARILEDSQYTTLLAALATCMVFLTSIQASKTRNSTCLVAAAYDQPFRDEHWAHETCKSGPDRLFTLASSRCAEYSCYTNGILLEKRPTSSSLRSYQSSSVTASRHDKVLSFLPGHLQPAIVPMA